VKRRRHEYRKFFSETPISTHIRCPGLAGFQLCVREPSLIWACPFRGLDQMLLSGEKRRGGANHLQKRRPDAEAPRSLECRPDPLTCAESIRQPLRRSIHGSILPRNVHLSRCSAGQGWLSRAAVRSGTILAKRSSGEMASGLLLPRTTCSSRPYRVQMANACFT